LLTDTKRDDRQSKVCLLRCAGHLNVCIGSGTVMGCQLELRLSITLNVVFAAAGEWPLLALLRHSLPSAAFDSLQTLRKAGLRQGPTRSQRAED